MWSTARFESHSELARQKPKREFVQKTPRTRDLKLQKRPNYMVLMNKRKHEFSLECKCYQPKNKKKVAQEDIWEETSCKSSESNILEAQVTFL